MAITQVGTPNHVKTTASSGITAPADTTPANLLVLTPVGPGSGYCAGKSNPANTWVDGPVYVSAAGSAALAIDYVLSAPVTGAAQTFTTVTAFAFQCDFALFFAGVGTYDQESGASNTISATSQPASAGAMTPGGAGALLVSVISFGANPGTITPPTGFTLIDQANLALEQPGAVAIEIQPGAATARTPVWGTSIAVVSCAATMIWLPSAGAVTSPATLNQFVGVTA